MSALRCFTEPAWKRRGDTSGLPLLRIYDDTAGLCPVCGSKYISGFKAGTQKIEQVVKARFPQARVLRMDMDTTRTKDGYEQILSAFSNHEADILIGTQMIVKGHDFPGVTLVGVLAADLSLYISDYRASERTFQLLTQAAGRAGRGDISRQCHHTDV